MSAGDVWLGTLGGEILLPRAGMRLTWSDTEITNEQRTADGTLVSDLRAVKRHWELPFDPLILGSDLDSFIALYDLHADLSLLVSNEDASVSAYTVKLRPLAVARELVRDVWLWSGAKIVLDQI